MNEKFSHLHNTRNKDHSYNSTHTESEGTLDTMDSNNNNNNSHRPNRQNVLSTSSRNKSGQITTLLTLVLGFSLGVTVAFFLSSVVQSSNDLTAWNAAAVVHIDSEEQNRPTILLRTHQEENNVSPLQTTTTSKTRTTTDAVGTDPPTTPSLANNDEGTSDSQRIKVMTTTNVKEGPSAAAAAAAAASYFTTSPLSAPTTTSASTAVASSFLPPNDNAVVVNVPHPNPPPNNSIVEFERVPGGGIVTKIHGPKYLDALIQSMCLLHYAYNNRVFYDIIVFTATPISDAEIAPLRQLIAPANLTLVMDNPGLQTLLTTSMSPQQQAQLIQRCNVTSLHEIAWETVCHEPTTQGKGTWTYLSYTWQCEFRSLHIWTHPALAPYKYMLWMDTDGFCTRVWDRDPIATMAQHDLALLFDNFPMGSSRDATFTQRYRTAFNNTLCGVDLKNGHLSARTLPIQQSCRTIEVKQVHGFFHVSNLDFYRSEPVLHWARTLIGDSKFSRQYDDQIGITAPAAVLAPERAWDMAYHGLDMRVFHNFVMDGKPKQRVGGFIRWWKLNGNQSFPEALGKCPVTNAGR
jgi:hypothetical protein